MMAARVAKTCDGDACTQLLVRGDAISFVSVEQARLVGCGKVCPMKLDDEAMPSDVRLPKNYVLVHDTEGTILGKCDFYVVKWRGNGGRAANPDALPEAVTKYFGNETPIRAGSVEIPDGPWKRVCQVRFIRYRRHGYHEKGFEHEWAAPQWLYVCERPLAWKVPLPAGCQVTEKGFERP